jgi:ribonuclease HI
MENDEKEQKESVGKKVIATLRQINKLRLPAKLWALLYKSIVGGILNYHLATMKWDPTLHKKINELTAKSFHQNLYIKGRNSHAYPALPFNKGGFDIPIAEELQLKAYQTAILSMQEEQKYLEILIPEIKKGAETFDLQMTYYTKIEKDKSKFTNIFEEEIPENINKIPNELRPKLKGNKINTPNLKATMILQKQLTKDKKKEKKIIPMKIKGKRTIWTDGSWNPKNNEGTIGVAGTPFYGIGRKLDFCTSSTEAELRAIQKAIKYKPEVILTDSKAAVEIVQNLNKHKHKNNPLRYLVMKIENQLKNVNQKIEIKHIPGHLKEKIRRNDQKAIEKMADLKLEWGTFANTVLMGNEKADQITNEKNLPPAKIYSKHMQQPFFHKDFLPILNIREYLTKVRVKRLEKKKEIKELLQETKNKDTVMKKAKLWYGLNLQGFAYKIITEKLPTRKRNRDISNKILNKRKKEVVKMICPLCGKNEKLLDEEETIEHFLKCHQHKAGEKAMALNPHEWLSKELKEKKIKLTEKTREEVKNTPTKYLAAGLWPKSLNNEIKDQIKEEKSKIEKRKIKQEKHLPLIQDCITYFRKKWKVRCKVFFKEKELIDKEILRIENEQKDKLTKQYKEKRKIQEIKDKESTDRAKKKYKQVHKARVAEQDKKYREKNREKINQKAKD